MQEILTPQKQSHDFLNQPERPNLNDKIESYPAQLELIDT